MVWNHVYARAPRWLQSWILNAREWHQQRQRLTPEFFELLAEYEARTFAPAEWIASQRDQRLAEFVLHAADTTPYYREVFARLHFDPRAIRTLDDLAALPILRAADVQNQWARLRSTAVPMPELCQVRQVPLSDSPRGNMTWPVTLRGHREQWAVRERFWRWYGVGHDAWRLDFSGQPVMPGGQRRPPYWRTIRAGRMIVFSVEHLCGETADEYLSAMRRSDIPWIHGQPAAVATLARHARASGVKLPIRHVTLTGCATPEDEGAVVEALGVKPAQQFTADCGTANLSQCPAGALHVDEEYSAVEFLPRGGGMYSLIGTNLSNPAFPLVRFDTGYLAKLDSARCHCGRPGRVVRDLCPDASSG